MKPALLIAVCVLATVFAVALAVHPALGELRRAVHSLENVIGRMNMVETTSYKTTWKDAEGLEHTVDTPRLAGETAADHAARHKVDVDALKALFPPVDTQ